MNNQNSCGFSLSETMDPREAAKIHARTLAYIGDSVFELGMRLKHTVSGFSPGRKLQGSIVKIVCAEYQAAIFEKILEEVCEEEKTLLKTWRNAKGPRKPLSVDRAVYSRSTAFEAWIGFLFLTGQNERILEIFERTGRGIKPAAENDDSIK